MTAYTLSFQRYLVILLCASGVVDSFPSPVVFSAKNNAFSPLLEPSASSSSSLMMADDAEPLYLSDNHIATLRKESAKRIANKRMPVVFLPESETNGDFRPSLLAQVCHALETAELVQVRGLSRDSKKQIRKVADMLTIALGMEMGKDVNLVMCKGHSAVYYAEADDDDEQDGGRSSTLKQPKIKLHTSVGKKNQWTKKPKPVRDNRGQIIPGLYE